MTAKLICTVETTMPSAMQKKTIFCYSKLCKSSYGINWVGSKNKFRASTLEALNRRFGPVATISYINKSMLIIIFFQKSFL